VPLLRVADALVGVDGEVGQRTIRLIVDTQGGGSGLLLCDPNVADALAFSTPRVVIGAMQVAGASARTDLSAARLAGAIRVGRVIMERPIVSIVALPRLTGCLMGFEALKHFAVSIDQRSMRLRLAGPTRIAPSPSIYSVGMSVAADETGAVRVTSAGADNPAAAAGVKVGDEILELDGKPASAEWTTTQVIRELAQRGRRFHMKLRRDGRVVSVEIAPWPKVP